MDKNENLTKGAEQSMNEENLEQNLESDNNADIESDVQTEEKVKADESQSSDASCCEEVEKTKAQLIEKTRQCEEYFNKLQRIAAEFDNYKKRTAKEKEALYLDATSDVVAAFLPVVDNLERALEAAKNTTNADSLKEGIELVYRQIRDVLGKLDVEVIEAVGNEFDPNLHNAVSHIEDEQYGENVVVEEFQKGYICKDKVIRHSMVKVAN